MRRLAAILACAAMTGLACLAPLRAQDSDEMLFGGMPLENAAVDHDFALRLRLETQMTEDDDDVVETDPQYARFPTRMYSGEAKVFQSNRATYGVTYSQWENKQDLDVRSWAWKIRYPIAVEPQMIYDTYDTGVGSFLSLQYRTQEDDQTNGTRSLSYYSVAADRFFENGIYAFLQYRHTIEDGHGSGHQLSEYANWKLSNRLKIGEQAAVSSQEDADNLTPWYARVFGTYFLAEDWTSMRVEARHYEAGGDFRYQEYKAYFYQKIGSRSLVRLSYRYYTDNDDMSSNAYGIKLKHYVSPRFSVHFGYRYYDHRMGTDLDTFYSGLNLLL
jgi:hypothetical protein